MSKLNIRQQECILKAAITHQQVMSNILSHESHGLTFIDGPSSEINLATPRQVILSLIGLTEETKDEKVFITVKKD